jgi:catechol 2,3-dioxygenase-like lactoylglutathione lyase family enzyme
MVTSAEKKGPALTQVALCTSDLAATVRLYTHAFGFADARGEVVSGPRLAAIQEVGDDLLTMIWWLVGRTGFMQLELFQHSVPAQRSQPADWRPSDLGWVRWGLAVTDLDACISALTQLGCSMITQATRSQSGARRVAFRDPYVGCIVEVVEDGEDAPGGARPAHFGIDPAILYATVSVADLDEAGAFFIGALGLREVAPDLLHSPEDEALWGLSGADRELFVVEAGAAYIEVVQYVTPQGRPHPPDYRLSDLGMMNAAFGYRSRADLDVLVADLANRDIQLTSPLLAPGLPAGGYLHGPDGISIEVMAVPAEFDGSTGFIPRADGNVLKRLHPGTARA